MGRYQINRLDRKGTHFTWEERLILHRLMNREKTKIKSPQKLALIFGKSKRTIQREIKRGWTTLQASDLSYFKTYSPDLAQLKTDENLKAKGPDLKLGRDFSLVQDISHRIKEDHFSPDAIIMHYNKTDWPSETRICTRTLYRYIAEGLIPGVTSVDLLHKGKRSTLSKKVPRRHARAASARKSITLRPEQVNLRLEEGHWEMDCVVSGKGKGNEALLTLTERSKRYQIIRKIKDQSAASVTGELDKLERLYGSKCFRNIFKTITCDNGSEFMNTAGMENSCLTKKLRTDIFYAHPYCASERGSNENANGIIRRFIPKGTAIKDISKVRIKEIQDWMNNYPRRLLGGLSSKEAFHTAMAV